MSVHKDSRMTAAFIMKEIDKAADLGLSHVQLDDGWQQGLSRNSAHKSGVKWEEWSREDWNPHDERFPNGFKALVDYAKSENIRLGLWFNPSQNNSYAHWERDADILIDYFRRFGISVFKIDGLSFYDKRSETNIRKLLDKVFNATSGQVTFNMDVTANKRAGYHYLQEYGNLFLENRYTDWGNYYPYRTLRNVWLLSGYVPAERLQVEILNINRNRDKYHADDPLSPENTGWQQAFAVGSVGQPLFWMELSGLGTDDLNILQSGLEEYHRILPELQGAIVLPIGEEPTGFTWSGFVWIKNNQPTHALIFKGLTTEDTHTFNLPGHIENVSYLSGAVPLALDVMPGKDRITVKLQGRQASVFLKLEQE
ncbi:alpha-galactosidase [Anditalea andensis]|uniref:Alpha-galactosidase n=1 Tax=Anditalea andensis TaxID=1048983 RepID=A0A074L586_9BACT|nr:alpha-galactosidase [Anditalea andensis]KEO75605.1 hypothetical protein EL17_00490 [Anditalea andensis]